MSTDKRLIALETALAPLQTAIAQHPLMATMTTLAAVQTLMAHHVFAVWDFVCLMKAVSYRIVGNQLPWFPPADPASVRLMQEMLLDEESDQMPDGIHHGSHFSWYLKAMAACGADTRGIHALLETLRTGESLQVALQHPSIPQPAQAFVSHTFSLFDGATPALVAAFVYGREAMTPGLFTALAQQLRQHDVPRCQLFLAYLDRHILLDADHHLPKAQRMLINLCGEDQQQWAIAQQAAKEALGARLALLTGISDAILSNESQ